MKPLALVRFGDGTILHGAYDTVKDYAISALYETEDEVHAMLRAPVAARRRCTCDGPVSERASYWVASVGRYAEGFYGDVLACRRCRVITLQTPTLVEGAPRWVLWYNTRHYTPGEEPPNPWQFDPTPRAWESLDTEHLWSVAAWQLNVLRRHRGLRYNWLSPNDQVSGRYRLTRAIDELKRRGALPSFDDLRVAWDHACANGLAPVSRRDPYPPEGVMPESFVVLWLHFVRTV